MIGKTNNMDDVEIRLKELIISRYGSLKKFCEIISMPWTTLDSILKRGVVNSNLTNILKITRELHINTERLAEGSIISKSRDDDSEESTAKEMALLADYQGEIKAKSHIALVSGEHILSDFTIKQIDNNIAGCDYVRLRDLVSDKEYLLTIQSILYVKEITD